MVTTPQNFVPPPPPPRHPDRSGWLVAFGVVEILLGLVCVMFAATMAAMKSLLPPEARAQMGNATPILMALFYLAFAALFFVMAYGSIRKRNWGRILCLVASSAWLVVGVLIVLVYAAVLPGVLPEVQRQQPPGGPEVNMGIVMAFMFTFMTIFMVALPLVMVLFYSRPSVKDTCLRASGGKAWDYPVLLALLVFYYTITLLASAFSLFSPKGTILFGFVIPGWATKIFFFITIAIVSFVIYSFVKRNKIGWNVAVAFAIFWMLSSLGTLLFMGDVAAAYRKMGMSEAEIASIANLKSFTKIIQWGAMVVMFIHFGLLLYARKYFETSPAQPRFDTPPPVIPPSAPPPAPNSDVGPAM